MAESATRKPLLLRKREVAQLLGCCEKTVYNLTAAGVLRVVYLGTSPRWRLIDVEAAVAKLANQSGEGAPKAGGAA